MHFSTIITYGDFNDNNVSETLPNSEEQRNNLAFVEKRRNMFKKSKKLFGQTRLHFCMVDAVNKTKDQQIFCHGKETLECQE